MKILKIITTVLSVLTGIYILHSIILPAIFKDNYYHFYSNIIDRITNIIYSDSDFTSTIMIHIYTDNSIWHVISSTILPIVTFLALTGVTVWLNFKVKK